MTELTALFKVLSDETRLRMLLLLEQNTLCVCEMAGILDVSQPTISKGLSKLRDLKLVSMHRQEKYVYYTLEKHDLLLSLLKILKQQTKNHALLLEDQRRVAKKLNYHINPLSEDSLSLK